MCAVSDVGVVSRVLDDDGLGPRFPEFTTLDLELDAPLPALSRQLYVDPGLRSAACERAGRGLGSSGGTGSRGPACPELLALGLLHARGHGGLPELTWWHLLPSPSAPPGGTCARTRGCRDETVSLQPQGRDRPV